MATDINELWNSPLVGAYLLWRFALGYKGYCGRPPNIALAFPALTILSLPKYSDSIKESFQTLERWVSHFIETDHRNVMSDLGNDIRERREFLLSSLDMAFTSELVDGWRCPGVLDPVSIDEKRTGAHAIRFRKDFGVVAGRLGRWFAMVSPRDVTRILEVKIV